MVRFKQTGIAALLLLVITSIAGSVVMSLYSFNVGHGEHRRALSKQFDLLQAHNALISYTAHYPYLYGPRGAGVGHFPCPDTDDRGELGKGDWLSRSGPNPPCGNYSTTTGSMPAHISYSGHRYLFSASLQGALSYRLSGQLINNPPNRRVSPETLLKAQKSIDPWIVIGKSIAGDSVSPLANVGNIVTPASIMITSKMAVAAWLVQRIRKHESLSCALINEITGSDIKTPDGWPNDSTQLAPIVISPWCASFREAIERCNLGDTILESLSLASLPNGGQLSDNVRLLHSQLIIVLIADRFPSTYDCDTPLAHQLEIEGVPAKSHWFVRNQWEEWIQLEPDHSCQSNPARHCTFIGFTQHYQNARPIAVHWGER